LPKKPANNVLKIRFITLNSKNVFSALIISHFSMGADAQFARKIVYGMKQASNAKVVKADRW